MLVLSVLQMHGENKLLIIKKKKKTKFFPEKHSACHKQHKDQRGNIERNCKIYYKSLQCYKDPSKCGIELTQSSAKILWYLISISIESFLKVNRSPTQKTKKDKVNTKRQIQGINKSRNTSQNDHHTLCNVYCLEKREPYCTFGGNVNW